VFTPAGTGNRALETGPIDDEEVGVLVGVETCDVVDDSRIGQECG
jgi:hypothetical protein